MRPRLDKGLARTLGGSHSCCSSLWKSEVRQRDDRGYEVLEVDRLDSGSTSEGLSSHAARNLSARELQELAAPK